MHYFRKGSKNGLPVIFIHGFPFNHTMWQQQYEALPGDEFLAIAYDVRGLGKSPVGDGQYTIDQFADDLNELYHALGIEKAVLCGLSMGGYIALRFAEKFPEKLLGLILADTKSEPDNNETKLKRAQQMNDLRRNDLMEFAEGSLKAVFSEKSISNDIPEVRQIKNMVLANDAIGIRGCLLAMAARTDTTPVLQNIKVPTLLLAGEDDKITTPEVMQQMTSKIPDAEFHIVPHAAHMSNLENPSYFNEKMLAFLQQLV